MKQINKERNGFNFINWFLNFSMVLILIINLKCKYCTICLRLYQQPLTCLIRVSMSADPESKGLV